MNNICCCFLNLPIELKPSLVPLVPRYLSFCNPELVMKTFPVGWVAGWLDGWRKAGIKAQLSPAMTIRINSLS